MWTEHWYSVSWVLHRSGYHMYLRCPPFLNGSTVFMLKLKRHKSWGRISCIIHLCLKEDLVNDDWSILIVFIWSLRRDDCNIHFITTHFCSNMSIDRIESMALFNTLYLTHWAAWEDLLLTWKHKYYLPTWLILFFVNSTGARGKLVINGVKRGY